MPNETDKASSPDGGDAAGALEPTLSDQERRAFIAKYGRFAAVTPVALAVAMTSDKARGQGSDVAAIS